MKTFLITFFTFSILLIATASVYAQPGLPGPPSQAPIDGGLGLLAVAGGAYAWKKLRNTSDS